MIDETDGATIKIDSPFSSLVTNAVKLAKFAEQLAEIAERAGKSEADRDNPPILFKIGEHRCTCHPNGGL